MTAAAKSAAVTMPAETSTDARTGKARLAFVLFIRDCDTGLTDLSRVLPLLLRSNHLQISENNLSEPWILRFLYT